MQPPDLQQLQQQIAALTASFDSIPYLVTALLLLPIAVACLVLWWNARQFRAFGSVGMYLLMVSVLFYADYRSSRLWDAIFTSLASLFIVEMTADALHVAKRRWIGAVRLVCLAGVALAWVQGLHWFLRVPVDLSNAVVMVLLIIRLRRPVPQARLILPAIGIIWLFRLPLDPTIHSLVPLPFTFTIAGLRWYFGPCAMVLFGALAIAIFVRELIEDQREKERLAGELEAGRAMQQVLLGAEIPVIPGFRIESVYKPASEVGGDFFGILPAPPGGVLVVIGDVSGKGLRAAMTVSAILGSLRAMTVAAPAELLCALNRILIGSVDGGFVTCCIAHIAPGGFTTTANAGHLAPYRNGEEIPLSPGLPLGITPDTEYVEYTSRLAPGDRLTFLSDGVVEAQNVSGELLGFDRTRAISSKSAEAIALAAQTFGQEDDITVLTLQYAPAEVKHA